MRYHHKSEKTLVTAHGHVYKCNHPLYSACTLYKDGDKGLAVIQKRFNEQLKVYWYGPIDSELVDSIFSREGFSEYFHRMAGDCTDGVYPTVTVRQIMWALRMKPLKKAWWESQELHSL